MMSKMAAVLRQWREASTLILISARQRGSNVKPVFVGSPALSADVSKGTNFEVLLLKRSASSKFMPSLYVFPGGAASDVDFSAEWIQVFDLLGKDQRQNLFDFAQRGGQGAPIFSRLREKQFSQIPSEIAFRICAVRETFEESGVLIARKVEKGKNFQPALWDRYSWASYCQDESVIDEWRHRVNRDPREFLNMCQQLEIVPDVWSLYEWSNWLTPLGSKRRFDTAFYICCVDGRPHVAEDRGETVHAQWASPFEIKQQYSKGEVNIAPPQVYETGRLMQFKSTHELLECAWKQGQHRVERLFPVRVNTADDIVSVLPGDSLFPQDVDPEGRQVSWTFKETLAELARTHPNMHRFELFRGPGDRIMYRAVCNIDLPGEHIGPASDATEEPRDSVRPVPKL